MLLWWILKLIKILRHLGVECQKVLKLYSLYNARLGSLVIICHFFDLPIEQNVNGDLNSPILHIKCTLNFQ